MLALSFYPFGTTPPPMSDMENAQKYTAAWIRAEEYSPIIQIATRAIGYFALVVGSIVSLGIGLDFTLGVWEKISQEDAMQNIAVIASGNKHILPKSAPTTGWFTIPPFSKVGEDHYRIMVKSAKGYLSAVYFKKINDKYKCSNPRFMKDSIPNDELVSAIFANNAKSKTEVFYTGYTRELTQTGIFARNFFAFSRNIGLFSASYIFKGTIKVLDFTRSSFPIGFFLIYFYVVARIIALDGLSTVKCGYYRNIDEFQSSPLIDIKDLTRKVIELETAVDNLKKYCRSYSQI